MINVTKGQTVFALNIGNAARNQEGQLKPVIVRSVGRKYFRCSTESNPDYETEYKLENGYENTQYSANSRIYLDRTEWENEKEASAICREILKEFDYGRSASRLPLPVLRQIKSLLSNRP